MKDLIVIFLLSSFLFSCSEKQEQVNDFNDSIIQQVDSRYAKEIIPFNLNFPKGTVFEKSGNRLKFTLPKPYYVLGLTDKGTYARSISGGSGDVTCTCTSEEGGCSPVKLGSDMGCLMSDCSTCTKSTSIAGVEDVFTDIMIVEPEGSNFVTQFKDLEEKRLLDPKFIDSPEITKFIKELESNFMESRSNGTKVVFINAYGYILPIEIPDDIDNTSIAFRATANGAVSCECNTEGSCPKKKKMVVTYCDATSCQSCTMSGIIVNQDDELRRFSLKNGVITLR